MTDRRRIAVTGARGQLAAALLERAASHGVDVVAVARPALDLARPGSVDRPLAEARPDAIVHAAAYTDVDRAEDEPALAALVNVEGARAVALAAARLGVPIVHVSTDYVFDGAAGRPYREDDAPRPLGVYGRTKLLGEAAVAAETADHAIVRTAWLFGPHGRNFVTTMLGLARGGSRREIDVVADQVGCPTSSLGLADGLLGICLGLLAGAQGGSVIHLAGAGEASRAEFAAEIFARSAALGGPHARVRPVPSESFPSRAARPADSRLDCASARDRHGVRLPDWRRALSPCISRILMAGGAR